jgi:hypothetical protein
MITFFSDPYPEELLYSVIARYQERIMVINRKAALLDLFGTANALAVVNLPSHLGALVSNLPPGNPYSPEILIKRHTLLPYFAPFLEHDQLESVIEDMIGERGPAVAGRAGIMASTVKDPATLQFCLRCVHADRSQYGEAFWHRVHQLPGVCFCPHHQETMLFNSSVSTHNVRTCIPGIALMLPVFSRSPGSFYDRPGSATTLPNIQRSYHLSRCCICDNEE